MGKQGHKHMLAQAAAMLISLPTLLAVYFRPVELPPLLRKWLAVTCPPGPGFRRGFLILDRYVLLVIHSAIRLILYPVHAHARDIVGGHTRRWRWQADSMETSKHRPQSTRLGRSTVSNSHRQCGYSIIRVP